MVEYEFIRADRAGAALRIGGEVVWKCHRDWWRDGVIRWEDYRRAGHELASSFFLDVLCRWVAIREVVSKSEMSAFLKAWEKKHDFNRGERLWVSRMWEDSPQVGIVSTDGGKWIRVLTATCARSRHEARVMMGAARKLVQTFTQMKETENESTGKYQRTQGRDGDGSGGRRERRRSGGRGKDGLHGSGKDCGGDAS